MVEPAVAFTMVLQALPSLNLFSCLYMPLIMADLMVQVCTRHRGPTKDVLLKEQV